MLILLPPSEGKTSPTQGPTLDLDSLAFPELAESRERAIEALGKLGDGPEAVATLGLGKKSAHEASLNLTLFTAPCAPAIDLYTGVLFDHLDASSLDAQSRERLNERTWIGSALFGLVTPAELLPNHRLSIGVSLPPLGSLGRWWRTQIKTSVPGQTVFDVRSAGYRSAFPASEANTIELSVVEERSTGRKVITHMAKKWRGIATRNLLQDRTLKADASTADLLAALERFANHNGELGTIALEVADPRPTRLGGSRTVATLVTTSTE